MARNFYPIPFFPYAGRYSSKAVNYCGKKATVVAINLVWTAYGAGSAVPNVNVKVNLQASGPNAIPAQFSINCVYIDNLGSDVPMYVFFPDTGDTVTAQPNSKCWYPVLTNGLEAWVIGMGFVDGDEILTTVFFSDANVQPYADEEISSAVALWRASADVSRGSTILNTDYGVPALGDQWFTSGVLIGSVNSVVIPQFSSPPNAFLYITYTEWFLYKATGAGDAEVDLLGSLSGSIFGALFTSASPVTVPGQTILRMQGNMKLSTNEIWSLRSLKAPGGNGQLVANWAYTTSPG